MKKLTRKQEAFVNEYLRDFNATQAALRVGYSKKGARQQGANLLSNVYISDAIQARINEKAMTADEALLLLADHARGSMGDFMRIEGVASYLDLEKAKELGLLHLIKKVRDRVVMTADKDGHETETHSLEVELYDAQAAADKILKVHGKYIERTEVSGGEPLKIQVEYVNNPTETARVPSRAGED